MSETDSHQETFRRLRYGFERHKHWKAMPTQLGILAMRSTIRVSWLDRPVLRQSAEQGFAVADTDSPDGRYAAYYDGPTRQALMADFDQDTPDAEGRLRIAVSQLKFRVSYNEIGKRIWAVTAAEKDIAQNVSLQDATEMIGEVYGAILHVNSPDAD